MSAPVYVGKHALGQYGPDVLDIFHRLDEPQRREVGRRWFHFTSRGLQHYKPCPDCRDTGMRRVERPLVARQWYGGSFTTGCHCAAAPPQLMNAPVVFSSPSAAATVKAGGVATTNDIGDDTTQPDKTQR